jgi:hypothetical protein
MPTTKPVQGPKETGATLCALKSRWAVAIVLTATCLTAACRSGEPTQITLEAAMTATPPAESAPGPGEPGGPPPGSETAQPSVDSAAAPPSWLIEADPASLAAVERAQKFLANSVGIAAVDIQIEAVEAVDWPDGSLGCPEPGQMYIQVITPGYRVRMRSGDVTYEVHTDDRPDGAITLCEGGPPGLPGLPDS